MTAKILLTSVASPSASPCSKPWSPCAADSAKIPQRYVALNEAEIESLRARGQWQSRGTGTAASQTNSVAGC